MRGKFLFLGTGGSLGVPVIGCDCAVCHSTSPFNKRLRPSGLIQVGGKTFLLDVGPDFRLQALKYQLNHLDGVLLTHTHFDHVGGFDELRVYSFKNQRRLPCLLSKESLKELQLRCHYLMHPTEEGKIVSSKFDFSLLPEDFGRVEFEGISFEYVTYFQAGMKVTGFRFGDFAYISDIRDYTDEVITRLKGVKTLVLSALRYNASEVHFNIPEAIAFAREVGASHTWLTHITHEIEYDEINAALPGDIRLSYDGLEIPFNL
jgi:phosphoribosyl 1,2-cyclic phosphate phosphodiesterase